MYQTVLAFLLLLLVAAVAIWGGVTFDDVASDAKDVDARYVIGVMGCIATVVAAIVFLVMICLTVQGTMYYKINGPIELTTLTSKLALMTQRRDDQSAIVRAELSKFPEIEKEIIGNIQPAILLGAYPELKSNEVIIGMVKALRRLDDDIVEIKQETIDKREKISKRYAWVWWRAKDAAMA